MRMHTFEWILVWSALLGVLSLFLGALHDHSLALKEAQQKMGEKWVDLECSARAAGAITHYVLISSAHCWSYPYAFFPPASVLETVLGGDANHCG